MGNKITWFGWLEAVKENQKFMVIEPQEFPGSKEAQEALANRFSDFPILVPGYEYRSVISITPPERKYE